jgi:cytidine deaminase
MGSGAAVTQAESPNVTRIWCVDDEKVLELRLSELLPRAFGSVNLA